MDVKTEWDETLFGRFQDRIMQKKRNGERNEWEVWANNKSVSANLRVKSMDDKKDRGKIKKSELMQMLKAQDYKCAISGRELGPSESTPDHIEPISRGGLNTIENIQILDSSINRAKGSMNNDEFLGMCCEIVNHLKKKEYCYDGFPSGATIDSSPKELTHGFYGVIDVKSCYTLKEFAQRTGLKRDAIRSARNQGLRVIYKHNRGYVRGQDWVEYLETVDGCDA